MKTIHFEGSDNPFYATKKLLSTLKVTTPENTSEVLAFKAIYPFRKDINFKKYPYSVTEINSIDDQVRYKFIKRLNLNFISLIDNQIFRNLKNHEISKIRVEIKNEADDNFFKLLARTLKKIEISFDLLGKKENLTKNYLKEDNSEEKRLSELLQKKVLSKEEHSLILLRAKESLSNDNPWIPIWLFARLRKEESIKPEFLKVVAKALTLLERPLEAAEYYRTFLLKSFDEFEKIKTKYDLSMLIIRVFPNYLKNLNEAKSLLEEAIKQFKNIKNLSQKELELVKISIENGLALVLAKEKKLKETEKLMKDLLKRILKVSGKKAFSKQTILRYNLAQTYKFSGKLEESVKEYNKLINIDPNYPEYHCELAKLFLQQKKEQKALTQLNIAIELLPTYPEALSLRGTIAFSRNDFEKAYQDFEKAYQFAPNSETLFNLALVLNSLKCFKNSINLLKKHFESNALDKYDDSFILLYCENLKNTGKLQEARSFIEEVIKLDPTNVNLKNIFEKFISKETIKI